jgi:acetoin utilization deacetylase AcuC-like enzyme
MRRIGLVDHPVFREHHTGIGHPESHERLIAIEKHLNSTGLKEHLVKVDAPEINLEDLYSVHQESYVSEMLNFCRAGNGYIPSMETEVGPATAEAALRAAGGCVHAADLVLNGDLDGAFAAVRPPGHHATNHIAMGFCLFNNIAIGAAHLVKQHGLKRILIVDWDLHHGNGTQHSFYDSREVLYFSTHQYPHYPGTGHWKETGSGKGEGFTVNVPLRAGKTDEEYLYIFRTLLPPIALEYKPEFILVSAGFDTYEDDPLGGMRITSLGFASLAAELMDIAAEFSQKRILLALEGGYSLQGLQDGVEQVLLQLAGEASRPAIDPKASASLESELAPVIQTQKQFWPLV